MARAKTTELILDSADYFAARLDNGGVRVGLKGEHHFDFPEGHKETSRVLACSTVEEVEILHDEFMCAYAYGA